MVGGRTRCVIDQNVKISNGFSKRRKKFEKTLLTFGQVQVTGQEYAWVSWLKTALEKVAWERKSRFNSGAEAAYEEGGQLTPLLFKKQLIFLNRICVDPTKKIILTPQK